MPGLRWKSTNKLELTILADWNWKNQGFDSFASNGLEFIEENKLIGLIFKIDWGCT